MSGNIKSTTGGKPKPPVKMRVYSTKYFATYARRWRAEHPGNCSAASCYEPVLKGSLCEKHRISNYEANRAKDYKRKIRVLTHYGHKGKLQCCWKDCSISDLDMLSIDHLRNNGAEARKQGYNGCGQGLYRKLEAEGYPVDFQTLCFNHQMKKEITRRKALRA